jgi:hypothetical protein
MCVSCRVNSCRTKPEAFKAFLKLIFFLIVLQAPFVQTYSIVILELQLVRPLIRSFYFFPLIFLFHFLFFIFFILILFPFFFLIILQPSLVQVF